MLGQQRFEVPCGEREGAQRRIGYDGRAPGAAVDEGDVPERLSRAQAPQPAPAALDGGSATQDQVEADSCPALLDDVLSGGMVDLARALRDELEVLLAQTLEE